MCDVQLVTHHDAPHPPSLQDGASILTAVAPVALATFFVATSMETLSYPSLAPCTEW